MEHINARYVVSSPRLASLKVVPMTYHNPSAPLLSELQHIRPPGRHHPHRTRLPLSLAQIGRTDVLPEHEQRPGLGRAEDGAALGHHEESGVFGGQDVGGEGSASWERDFPYDFGAASVLVSRRMTQCTYVFNLRIVTLEIVFGVNLSAYS